MEDNDPTGDCDTGEVEVARERPVTDGGYRQAIHFAGDGQRSAGTAVAGNGNGVVQDFVSVSLGLCDCGKN